MPAAERDEGMRRRTQAMDDERRRILRMLAEGTISVDECEELLRALSDRRTDKVERELRAAKGKRAIWPYVLLIALALVALPVWTIGVGAVRGILDGFTGPFGLLLLVLLARNTVGIGVFPFLEQLAYGLRILADVRNDLRAEGAAEILIVLPGFQAGIELFLGCVPF